MSPRHTGLDEEALTSERAFEWLHLLDKASARDLQAFHKWLERSPQNGGEVLMATSTELVLRQLLRGKKIDVDRLLATSANVLTVDDQRLPPEQRPRRKRLRLFAVAGFVFASATAVLLITVMLVRGSAYPHEYTTSVGEQRTVELPDGSAISINALSSVRVIYSDATRDAYLRSGQAMFSVAKDFSRPFRVHVSSGADVRTSTGNGTLIQAIGTKFDVRRRSDRINVAVVEGAVQVGADSQVAGAPHRAPARVAAGQAVSIKDSGCITSPRPVNPSDVLAWQQRRLVFADNTLEEITEEFRRYNRTPRIRIENDALRSQRFSGVFDADRPEALLMYLMANRSITLDRNGDDVVVRMKTSME